MEDYYYKLDSVAKLSKEEIDKRIATPCCKIESSNIESSNIEDMRYHIVKLYSILTVDEDIISDGEVIDMMHNYLESIDIGTLINRKTKTIN